MIRFLLPLALLLAACERVPLSEITLSSANQDVVHLQVEIASTPEQHSKGLAHREELPEDRGMLFVFGKEQPLSFWMRNTLIPLDIMYFDDDGKFVAAHSMVPCKEDPCETYSSEAPARTALEVSAGFVEQHGIGEGWSLSSQVGNSTTAQL